MKTKRRGLVHSKITMPPDGRNEYGGPLIVGRHFAELDGIRGIAIGLVLVFHCSSIASPKSELENLFTRLASAGWIGVDLFFVLSGFLITAILLDTYKNASYFRSFYIRRVLRIFPLYYAFIALWTFSLWVSR